MPLVQHLSNTEFGHEVHKLLQISKGVALGGSEPVGESVTRDAVCACGCGCLVVVPRQFVNQEHYNIWMRQRAVLGAKLAPINLSSPAPQDSRSAVLIGSAAETRIGPIRAKPSPILPR